MEHKRQPQLTKTTRQYELCLVQGAGAYANDPAHDLYAITGQAMYVWTFAASDGLVRHGRNEEKRLYVIRYQRRIQYWSFQVVLYTYYTGIILIPEYRKNTCRSLDVTVHCEYRKKILLILQSGTD